MKTGEKVSAYTQRFRAIVTQCPDMAVADRIRHYLRGLPTELFKQCNSNAIGEDWTDLESLIRWADAVERRAERSGNAKLVCAGDTTKIPSVAFAQRPHKKLAGAKRKRAWPSSASPAGAGAGAGPSGSGSHERPNNYCHWCRERQEGGFKPSHLRTCEAYKDALAKGLVARKKDRK